MLISRLPPGGKCPAGWEAVGEVRCYKVFRQKVPFASAQQTCK